MRGACWGSKAEGLANSNDGETRVMNAITEHIVIDMEILANPRSPQAGSLCGCIYSGRSRVLLQCLKGP
jgi:hypothetical protein